MKNSKLAVRMNCNDPWSADADEINEKEEEEKQWNMIYAFGYTIHVIHHIQFVQYSRDYIDFK